MIPKIVTINVSDQVMECKLFVPSEQPKVSVVMVHGWSSSDAKYLPLGEQLASQAIATLAVTLRGHGNSPYQLQGFSRKDHQHDVLAALAYMRQSFSTSKLCLLGKSYGGYLSATVASNQSIDYLVLSQPALYPDRGFSQPTLDLINNHPDIYQSSGESPATNTAIRMLSLYTNPLLFIASEHDEEIPEATIENYLTYANSTTTKIVLKGADHSLTQIDWRQNFYDEVVGWITTQQEKLGE